MTKNEKKTFEIFYLNLSAHSFSFSYLFFPKKSKKMFTNIEIALWLFIKSLNKF